jgi:hypothetical protein
MMLSNVPLLLFIGVIGVSCAFVAAKHWQQAVLGVFVLMVFEGAIRKWVFPSGQALVYLLKDGILLVAYIGFMLSVPKTPGPKDATSVKVVLWLSFFYGCLEVFNPDSPSILIGLLGLKNYFLYAPIAFIFPYIITSREQFLELVRRYLILAIPVAILGFIQVAAGPGSSLNTYVGNTDDAPSVIVYFGGHYDIVRTTGTFSYITGYTAFLTFIAFLGIGYNLSQGWRVWNNIAPVLALTLVIGAMFTTGSRAPVYTLIAAWPIILLFALLGQIVSPRIVLRLLIIVPCLAFAAMHISSRAFQAFTERATELGIDDTSQHMVSNSSEVIGAISGAPTFGLGIGTTHPAALMVMGTDQPWWLQDLLTEGELARITVETGIIGLTLTLFLRILITLIALRWAITFRDPIYRALGISLAVYLAFALSSSIMLNPTAGLYYWGTFGLLIVMRELDRRALSRSRSVVTLTRTPLTRPAVPAA